jgi:hypothetical protein
MRSTTTIIVIVMVLGLLAGAVNVRAEDVFDPDAMLRNATFAKELKKVNSDAAAEATLTKHANTAFGNTKTIFDFAAKLAGGDYAEQIEKIMDVPVQQWNPNRGWSGSYDIVNVKRIVAKNRTASLFGRVKGDMGNLATALGVYAVMKDVYAGYNGNNASKLKAIKGTYDLVSGYWASKLGMESLGTAMLGVGVISYSLSAFEAEARQQYTDYWWNAYSQFLGGQYPNMVSGRNNWADLARTHGEAGIVNRLNEFWDAPYDNAVRFYGQASLSTPPALAENTLKNKFAAQYYHERIHTTLKTHFTLEAEKAEASAYIEAKNAWGMMMANLRDLEQLRLAVLDAQDAEDEEEEITLVIRPAAKTIKVGETMGFTTWAVGDDGSQENVTSRTAFSGDASGSSFTGTEVGTFSAIATYMGLSIKATITVEEADEEDEEEIDETIDEIKDDEETDELCSSNEIGEMQAMLVTLAARAEAAAARFDAYRAKYDKELADRAAEPCENSLLSYCYTSAGDAARDLDEIVGFIRDLASTLILVQAFCPDETEAAGGRVSNFDIIKALAEAGSRNGAVQSSLGGMQSDLTTYGCDEDEFAELSDQFTEDGQDPNALQDGAGMGELSGDGVDNDADGLQEEDWSEVAGKTVTIVVYDSGSAKDDVFGLSVGGLGNLGTTPAGGLRTYGLDLSPGSYTATVTVVSAPDNCGTVTAFVVENGVEIAALSSGSGCPAVGSSLSMSFTVGASATQ